MKGLYAPFTIACCTSPYCSWIAIFAPLMLNWEQKGSEQSGPGEDHHYAGCLGQTPVSLPQVTTTA